MCWGIGGMCLRQEGVDQDLGTEGKKVWGRDTGDEGQRGEETLTL